jgi:hypothetical protein
MESVENILKKPLNVLVCFTDPEIGRVLSRMAVSLAGSRSEKSTATFLHLIEKENHDNQNKLEDFIDIIDKSKLTIRYFARRYDNYVSDTDLCLSFRLRIIKDGQGDYKSRATQQIKPMPISL